MSVSSAIGLVSSSLRNLLIGEMQLNPAVPVTILAPDETGGSQRVNLFLYKIEENSFLKNQDFTLKPGNSSELLATPLSLNLYYLLTPYAQNDPQTGNTTAHEILGEAMRVFYENSIIPQKYLETDLQTAREDFRIVYTALDPEELSRLWTTFAQPFRLSVRYQVSVIQVDQSVATEQPLRNRVRRIGVPSVQAPFAPPFVVSIAQTSGPAATSIVFSGTNLNGWLGTVVIDDQTVLNAQPLTGNTFSASVPATTLPGFYNIQVEISNLFRSMFWFEVTA